MRLKSSCALSKIVLKSDYGSDWRSFPKKRKQFTSFGWMDQKMQIIHRLMSSSKCIRAFLYEGWSITSLTKERQNVAQWGIPEQVDWNLKITWPLRSPDLIPADFILWGFVKILDYEQNYGKRDQLKSAIVTALQQVSQDMLFATMKHWVKHLNLLVEYNGGHNEM